jgi:hypothetical protein
VRALGSSRLRRRSRRPRLALAACLACVLALCGAGRARAEASNASTAVGAAWPLAAEHAGRIEGDHVVWQSSYFDSLSIDVAARWQRFDLARPVAGEIDAARSPGVTAVRDAGGAIVAFLVDADRAPDWRNQLDVVLRAPAPSDAKTRAITLAPPLPRTDAIQRLDVSGEGELRFEPATSDGLVHDIGSWSTPGISEDARHEVNEHLARHDTPRDDSPIYVKASAPVVAEGLRGRALTASERARPGLLLAIFLFLALGGACGAAYRALGRDARIEQAEAVLREEFERHGS